MTRLSAEQLQQAVISCTGPVQMLRNTRKTDKTDQMDNRKLPAREPESHNGAKTRKNENELFWSREQKLEAAAKHHLHLFITCFTGKI